jgi:hypothetical protein
MDIWPKLDSPSLSGRLLKALGLGIGSFFPAFFFSMPFTMAWANARWPGDGQSPLGAVDVSFYVGCLSALVVSVVLLKRASADVTHKA